VAGGAAEELPLPPTPPQLPPATSKNPPSLIASLLLFSFRGDGSNQYKSGWLGVKLFMSEKRGERATWV